MVILPPNLFPPPDHTSIAADRQVSYLWQRTWMEELLDKYRYTHSIRIDVLAGFNNPIVVIVVVAVTNKPQTISTRSIGEGFLWNWLAFTDNEST